MEQTDKRREYVQKKEGIISKNIETQQKRITGAGSYDPSGVVIEVSLKPEEARDLLEAKFKITWFRDGDSQTKFFHRSVILRKRKNRIYTLENDAGAFVQGEDGVREVLIAHFRQRWEPVLQIQDLWLPFSLAIVIDELTPCLFFCFPKIIGILLERK